MTRHDSPVVIAAGGTGGHVIPALAVADILMQRNVPVVWLGTRNGIEARLVPNEGIDLRWIEITGLRGKGLIGLLSAPVRLLRAIAQSASLLSSLKPRAVLGMGGFVSGPVGLAALLSRRPLVLHEQNAIAGMTNRYLSRWATRVFSAWPDVFPASVGALTVGNPVRQALLHSVNDDDGSRNEQLKDGLRVMVVGGSRGARILNEVVPKAIALLPFPVQVLHQSGRDDESSVSQAYEAITAGQSSSVDSSDTRIRAQVQAQVEAFIDDMGRAYSQADLVICRAGAMTVTELAARGVPSVLVPYPHAVDDHQTRNARRLSEAGAAVLMPQTELNASSLASQIEAFHDAPSMLTGMADAARLCFQANAAEAVADALLEVSH